MKKYINKLNKLIMTSMLILSTLFIPIQKVEANQVNSVGDTATRGRITGSDVSSFVWQSIPGYRTSSANSFTLVDNVGNEHSAHCIDSTLRDGIGEDLEMRMIKEESGTLRAGALWALDTDNVGSTRVNIHVPAKNLGFTTIPAIHQSSTISRNNMRMAMRWLMWTTGEQSALNTWRNDMVNLVSNAIPTLYYEHVRYEFRDKQAQDDYNVSTPVVESEHLSETQTQTIRNSDMGFDTIVVSSEEVRPYNYETVITNAEVREAYRGVLNSIATQVNSRIRQVAQNYANNRITIWQGRNQFQRFATRRYLEQSIDLSMKKVSSNPTLTNNNPKYNLTGIKYDVFKTVNNEKLGTFTLKADGTSNTLKLKNVRANEQVYIKEIDDAVRKRSGYKLNPDRIHHTLTRGTNIINTSDEPMDDPIKIELFKYDSRTGKKTPQGNASLENARFKFEYYPTDFTRLSQKTGTVQNTLIYKTNAQGKLDSENKNLIVSGTPKLKNGLPTFSLGTVVISEHQAPTGYLKSNEVIIVNFKMDDAGNRVIRKFYDKDGNELTNGKVENNGIVHTGYTFDLTNTSAVKPFNEEIIVGNIEVVKKDKGTNLAVPQGKASLSEIKYAVINRNEGNVKVGDVEFTPSQVVAILTTNTQGIARINQLPFGTYDVEELRQDATIQVGEVYDNSNKLGTSIYSNDSYLHTDDLNTVTRGNPNTYVVSKRSINIATHQQTYQANFNNQVAMGSIEVIKQDSETVIAQGNANLVGIRYAVINRSVNNVRVNGTMYAPNQVVAILTTADNGKVKIGNIPYGTYDVEELRQDATIQVGEIYDNSNKLGASIYANNSYLFTSTRENVVVDRPDTFRVEKKTVNIEVHDRNYPNEYQNQVVRGKITIDKKDKETNTNVGQGAGTLAGIRYAVINRSRAEVSVEGTTYAPNQVVAILSTNDNGKAELNNLPYGTYDVKELRMDATITVGEVYDNSNKLGTSIYANESYLYSDTPNQNDVAKQTVNVTRESETYPTNFANFVARGEFEIDKVDIDGNKMAYIPFLVSLLDANGNKVESHVILTDRNGRINTQSRVKNNTVNTLDRYVENGRYTGPLNDDASNVNVWFGTTPVTANRGVALYGNYLVEELQADTNQNQDMVTLQLAVDKENEVSRPSNIAVDLNIRMKSRAVDVGSDSNVLSIGENSLIKDIVDIIHVKTYNEYELVTEAVNVRNDGTKTVLGRSEPKRFTPQKVDNTNTSYVTVENEFTVDTRNVNGRVALVDYLYVIKNGQPMLISTHNKNHSEITQDLIVPEISTNALDLTMESQQGAFGVTNIQDTFNFKNFGNKSFFNILVELVDDNGNVVTDIDGKPTTYTKMLHVDYRTKGIVERGNTYIVRKDGSIQLPKFTVEGGKYKNLHIRQTVKDELTQEVIFEHNKDLNEPTQKVQFLTIETEAGSGTVQGMIANSKKAVISDKFMYDNLLEDRTVTSVIELVDYETEQIVETFTKENILMTKGNGQFEVQHTFDSTPYANKKLVVYHYVFTNVNGKEVLLGKHANKEAVSQQVTVPSIETTLYSEIGGRRTKILSENKEIKLVDVVPYKNVKVGQEIEMVSTAYNPKTQEQLKYRNGEAVTGRTLFTPTEPNGTVEVVMTFRTEDLINPTFENIVAFEDMKIGEEVFALHHDFKSKEQTVTKPTIKTRALSLDGSQNILAGKERKAKDIVMVTGFELDELLTFVVKAVDQETGEFITKDGKEVFGTVTTRFNGKDVEVPITLDLDRNAVLYEYVYLGDKVSEETLVVKEENKENKDQTLYVPKVKTTAISKETNTKTVPIKEKTVITDIVELEGKPFTKGIIRGTLMDKLTKSVFDIEGNKAEKEYTLDELGKATVELSFIVNTLSLQGKSTVVFEDMYENEKVIGVHHDFEDEGQTVYFPELKTQARDKADKDQIIDGALSIGKVVDTIFLKKLTIGKEYEVSGYPVLKSTGKPILVNGKPIVKSKTFVANSTSEVIELEYDIPASELAGETVVFFEKLAQDGLDIILHHDINDKEQSVNISLLLDIQVAKMDKDNVSYFLSGAEFTVFNEDGTIAKDVNGKEAIGVTDKDGKLQLSLWYDNTNKMYVKETKAPQGYVRTDEKFEIKKTGNHKLGVDLIKLNITNEALIVPPRTSDEHPVVYMIGLLFVSLFGFFVMRRKERE